MRPRNSPDLNCVEPAWFHLKVIGRRQGGPPRTKTDAKQALDELEQPRIQRWIRRMTRPIKEIIRLEGGNSYFEGSKDDILDEREHQRIARQVAQLQ